MNRRELFNMRHVEFQQQNINAIRHYNNIQLINKERFNYRKSVKLLRFLLESVARRGAGFVLPSSSVHAESSPERLLRWLRLHSLSLFSSSTLFGERMAGKPIVDQHKLLKARNLLCIKEQHLIPFTEGKMRQWLTFWLFWDLQHVMCAYLEWT